MILPLLETVPIRQSRLPSLIVVPQIRSKCRLLTHSTLEPNHFRADSSAMNMAPTIGRPLGMS